LRRKSVQQVEREMGVGTNAIVGDISGIAAIDLWISSAMSAVAGQSPVLDGLLLCAFQTDLLKLFPMIVVLIASPGARGRRESNVAGLLGAALALVGAAIAQHFGSDRVRPALSGLFDFPALPPEVGRDLVSFPSETAAMAFALAAALIGRGPRHAWFACAWSLVVICLPRLYGGYHYASDLVAGAIIGFLSYHLAHATSARRFAAAADKAGPAARAALHMVLIVYAFELSQFFADIRTIIGP
jgi:undecaprenyl-diphosphatase